MVVDYKLVYIFAPLITKERRLEL